MLHLWAKNFDDTDLIIASGWLGVVVLVTSAVLAGSFLLLRDAPKAAAASSLLCLMLVTYGHVFILVWRLEIIRGMRTAHLLLGLVWIAIAVGSFVLIFRTRRNLEKLLAATAVAMIWLVASALYTMAGKAMNARGKARVRAIEAARVMLQEPVPAAKAPPREALPDIYYIILDGYSRGDVLTRYHGHDNSPFLDGLRSRGFYVAEQSCANYAMTFLSLASSLNMTYLDRILAGLKKDSREVRPCVMLIEANRLSRFLKANGYQYATILTNYHATESSETADVRYSFRPHFFRSEFSHVLIRTSIASPWEPSVADSHRYSWKAIREAASLDGPTFLFAHLIIPHPPYVFDRQGNVRKDVPLSMAGLQGRRNRGEDSRAYVGQLMYTNQVVLELVDSILKSSSVQPVIIVQGDHGLVNKVESEGEQSADDTALRADQRIPILNAYFAPPAVRQKLYPTITPVNSFRILLSTLFGADLPLLEDRCYMPWYDRPYDMVDMTDRLIKGKVPPAVSK